ncbi:methionyl-tRNA formyltransferase [Buchnera aphidicola]|uniref:Methionyl-tRNA formyltransferase n=1 Tax=Buchnera aphidicola (Cinara strobi) TaxID=1921549 RepID=A0A3B1E3X8_9GAMM|nr:methionyl-tRNA formyltransferase [Buchnera aphidicola]VAX76772.1 Methionyl-tRNA formyltransferase [Buchnera aphidicola (Cinara strobi)]
MLKKISKVVFAGSNDFSLAHLNSLFYSSYTISAILTKPDNIFIKKKNNNFSSVKKFAIKKNIPLLQPDNLFEKKFYKFLLKIKADILIVSSYGYKIPSTILKIFPLGGINLHASLLPRWKGAAPIQWAILSGDKKTGISVIKMNSTIDAGKIIYTLSCPIQSTDTTISLLSKLIPISLQCMYQSLKMVIYSNTRQYLKQDKKLSTIAPKIKKKDGIINWSLTVIEIDRLIRAMIPWPCCQFLIKNTFIKIKKSSILSIYKNKFQEGRIIEISKTGLQVNTGSGILNIEKIQLPGKKTVHISQILHSKKKLFKKNSVLP